ncbi:cuticle protein 21-like [Zophobas morio]|uniref:cuticle protein 21-like n=1 Tax=Zophobas morio TaxID=2755281 RepID=UPI0030831A8E
MFKLFIVAALLAVASAKPGIVANTIAYSAPVVSHGVVAPIAAAPYAVAAPIARVAAAPVAIPAPVAYSTGAEITVHAEPVEQHGYKIVY